jgi:hypothetical protein
VGFRSVRRQDKFSVVEPCRIAEGQPNGPHFQCHCNSIKNYGQVVQLYQDRTLSRSKFSKFE